jgi:hypothetical protein
LAAAFLDARNGLLVPVRVPANAQSLRPEPSIAVTSKTVEPIPRADWRGKLGRCSLKVHDIPYIDGRCWIRLESDGSFQIMSFDEKYFAQVSRSEDEASGFWNEASGSTHASSSLGQLNQNGACWKNGNAQICAWNDL